MMSGPSSRALSRVGITGDPRPKWAARIQSASSIKKSTLSTEDSRLPPMKTPISAPTHVQDLEARWRLRERYWRRKLGRLRLGVEPVQGQLRRYRRVTWGR